MLGWGEPGPRGDSTGSCLTLSRFFGSSTVSSSDISRTGDEETFSLTRLPTVFATLAVSSIEEDTYGYVQQVLPATMEAIVRYRSALVSLQNELVMAASSLGPSSAAGAEEAKLLLAVPIEGEQIDFILVDPGSQLIGAACEGSMRRISERFGPSLSAFRFPPAIGHALADICKPA
jgi:nucleoporin NDC1